jgi:hypothetical protein
LSQQIPPPSRLRKGFLVVGLVLLILSFFFFYGASRVNWDYVTTHNDVVNLASPSYSSEYPQFGAWEYWVRDVIMQPNDFLTVSYPEDVQISAREIVLVGRNASGNTLLASGYAEADYTNKQPSEIIVQVCLIAQNTQNVTFSSTTTLNHYEAPQWGYFAIGVVLSSLAVIIIFKSKK